MKSINLFFEVAALVLYGLITVAVCSFVWGSETKPVFYVLAGLLFIANGYSIYRRAKYLEKTIKENGGIK